MPVRRKEKPKEQTLREKAIEFAKNVPKPQAKKIVQQAEVSSISKQYMHDGNA